MCPHGHIWDISKIQTKVDKELNTVWYPRCDPGTEKALSGKAKEIWIKSGVWLTVMFQCLFSSFTECTVVI